jgi:hypothetical protein
LKPATACREANYSRDNVKIKDDTIIRDNRNIKDAISSRTTRTRQKKKSATVEKSNIQQDY